MRTPASGFVFAKRSLICASTGMKRAAHSMRTFPASASARSFTSPRVFSRICTVFAAFRKLEICVLFKHAVLLETSSTGAT